MFIRGKDLSGNNSHCDHFTNTANAQIIEVAGSSWQSPPNTPNTKTDGCRHQVKMWLFCKSDLVEERRPAPTPFVVSCRKTRQIPVSRHQGLVLYLSKTCFGRRSDSCSTSSSRSGPHRSSAHSHPLNYRSRSHHRRSQCRILSTQMRDGLK